MAGLATIPLRRRLRLTRADRRRFGCTALDLLRHERMVAAGFRLPVFLRRVAGESMTPTLKPGQLLVAVRWPRRVRAGDIVVLSHDGLEKVKRVQKVDGRRLFVLGDNVRQSTDSRHFGMIDAAAVRGRVVLPVRRRTLS